MSRTFWKNEQTSSDITAFLNKSRKNGPAALSIQRDGATYFIGWTLLIISHHHLAGLVDVAAAEGDDQIALPGVLLDPLGGLL